MFLTLKDIISNIIRAIIMVLFNIKNMEIKIYDPTVITYQTNNNRNYNYFM